MTETAVAKSTSPKKKVAVAKAKPATSSHPSTAIMVTAAIKELKDKKGSTPQAIKKYLAANYQVDSSKLAPFIRKFLKAAVTKGLLVQTNGSGASGHFKLPVEVKKSALKKVVVKKPAAVKKTPGAAKKRSTAVKISKAEPVAKKSKKEVVTSKSKVVAKPAKSPAKVKKVPATKTKAPKAKKTPVKKTAPKKK